MKIKDILLERTPPGMEDWVKEMKPEFKKRYGKDWKRVLYATAWEQYNENIAEGDGINWPLVSSALTVSFNSIFGQKEFFDSEEKKKMIKAIKSKNPKTTEAAIQIGIDMFRSQK